MNNRDHIEKIHEKIAGIRSCMFITLDGIGTIKGRPMATQEIEFDGSIWFMTDKRSNKCGEITKNNAVGLQYVVGNGVGFTSLAGNAYFSEDKEKIEQFWNVFYKAWFNGPHDPNIILIEVRITRAEIWDNKAGKIGALADMAVGALTGKQNTLDEHEVIELRENL